ncbi:MAG: hypothetical protein WDZ59_09825 [Pirellulales bacterium]
MDKRLLEQLEACRPGSSDLSLPEMSQLAARLASDPEVAAHAARIQHSDAKFRLAFQEVDVPDDMKDRLLQRLAIEAKSTPAEGPVESAKANWRIRRWAIAAVCLAATIVGLLTAWWAIPNHPELTDENVEQIAEGWFLLVDQAGTWHQDKRVSEQYPVSPRVRGKVRRWMPLPAVAYDRDAVAYDLTPSVGGPRITLIVLRAKVEGLMNRPDPSPPYTQKRSISAWQSGNLLYVVQVEGRELDYSRYVDTSSPRLARQTPRSFSSLIAARPMHGVIAMQAP